MIGTGSAGAVVQAAGGTQIRRGPARRLGIVMPVQLADPDPQYASVHLTGPAPLGYLHLAANVRPPTARDLCCRIRD